MLEGGFRLAGVESVREVRSFEGDGCGEEVLNGAWYRSVQCTLGGWRNPVRIGSRGSSKVGMNRGQVGSTGLKLVWREMDRYRVLLKIRTESQGRKGAGGCPRSRPGHPEVGV